MNQSPTVSPFQGVKAMAVGLLLAAAPLATVSSFAQSGDTPAEDELFFETVDVNVVNVDVFVTDKKGNPVTDLAQEDFELRADGEPVEIKNFYASTGSPPKGGETASQAPPEGAALAETFEPTPVPTERPEEQKLNLVILIDNLNIRSLNRNSVFGALRQFLDGSVRDGDRVLVVTFDGAMKVRGNFSEEPEKLEPLLDALSREPGMGDELDQDLRFVMEVLVEGMPDGGSGPFGGPANLEDTALSTLAEAQGYAQRASNRVGRTLAAIETLTGQMAGISGRKAILYVGDGLPLRPGEAVFRVWFNTFERLAPGQGVISPQSEAQTYEMTAKFRDLIETANASGVMIHTLEASGHKSNRGASAASFPQRAQGLWTHEIDTLHTANLRESLRFVAEGTGGRALLGRTNLAEALEGVSRDLETYYSLGFSPDDMGGGKKKKGKAYDLKVKVKREGLEVRHRGSFSVKDATERAAESTLATALFKLAENPLGIALEAGAGTAIEGGRFEVPILIRVPLGQLVLVPQPENHQGRISMFIAARDDEGRSSPVRQVTFPVKVPNDQLFTALGQHISYTFKLQLREGHQTVAVGVRDEVAAVTANTALDVTVPGVAGG